MPKPSYRGYDMLLVYMCFTEVNASTTIFSIFFSAIQEFASILLFVAPILLHHRSGDDFQKAYLHPKGRVYELTLLESGISVDCFLRLDHQTIPPAAY